jgi:hypothetical protein
MIGDRGIDQEVQNKVDAYRGNPNALAQKYSQNQQLIDLLALQKLKSEKESAAREMQLKMGGQQMPTIAQARENEVLDLTKQELAQNTTGAMQNEQRQKQQAAKELVERSAQMPMQSQSPMTQGVAGLPANNMSPKAMAAGGIVAFQEGGRAEDEVDPALNAEMMRFIESQRQSPTREAPRQPEMGSLARQGIRNLIGTLTPQEVFRQRQEEATRAAGYSPEERDKLERHLKDRESIDARRFDPEKRRSDALTQFLLNAAGRTGIGSVLAGGGAGALNYRNAMDAEERAAMVDRQKQEAGIIDVGPAARLAGMKLGSEGERTAMTGLAQGVGDAVKLEQLAAQAAARGNPEEAKRLTAAARHISGDSFLKEGAKTLRFLLENGRTEDPLYNKTLTDMEARQNQIYKLYKIESPEIPMPSQSATPAASATEPGLFRSLLPGGSLAPFGSMNTLPTAARRSAPASGGVDTSNPLLRTN